MTNPEYNLEHDLLFAAFIKFVAANSKAVAEAAEAPYTLEQAFLGEFGDYTPSLQSNVNSPGWLRLKGTRRIPLIAAVLFSLAVSVGADAPRFAEEGMITIGNSMAPADDPCVAQVHQESLDFLEFLKLGEDWVRACEVARKVNGTAGMSSQSTVSQREGP